MQLRDALADFKRHADHANLFSGERRTVSGRFSGTGDRLVHVAPDGSLRDFGYPLSGQTGLERSRFGLRAAGDVTWFDDCASEQRYVGDTALVETVHETSLGEVRQYDLTVDRAHLTRFELSDLAADLDDAEILTYAGFAPDGRDDQIGQLRFEDAVELYHDEEHDFLASATGFAGLRGQLPRSFEEVLETEATELPRDRDGDRYEEARLSGSIVAAVDPAGGVATVASLLTDRTETSREHARGRLDELFAGFTTREAFERAAAADLPAVPSETPCAEAVAADLRVLTLLSAPTGLRIAGPNFDPYYRHSGGYGYTWFRDDAEIAQFLLAADERFDLGLDAWHRRSAGMYCQIQRADGSWPHRVWPRNGSLAPGWANARIEDGPDTDYQADQTGSVIAFLAALRDRLDPAAEPDLVEAIDETLDAALDGLDATLADDGRPVVCQNAWEDTNGRFAHTVATFLEAYATLAAAASIDDELRVRAAEGADRVYAALDDLWVPEREAYAMRETPDGEIDDRYDSASLALAAAHSAYDELAEHDPRDGEATGVDDERLDRLLAHTDSVLDGLAHESAESDVEGIVRYENDGWRRGEQASEKIWTVSTAWGANAAAELTTLLATRDDDRTDDWEARAEGLLGLIDPDGPLTEATSYLPEQFFDDGTPDSATPLGWPHAIRLATHATLAADVTSSADDEAVADD